MEAEATPTLDDIAPEQTVTAEAPANDPFAPLIGVPDAVKLTCPIASRNLNLVNVPGMVIATGAAVEVQFPGCKITTARENLAILV